MTTTRQQVSTALASVLPGHADDPDLLEALTDLGTALSGGEDPAPFATRLGVVVGYLGEPPSALVAVVTALATMLALDTTTTSGLVATAVDALVASRDAELVRLSALAATDPLTGLPVRSAFLQELERTCRRAARDGSRAMLLVIQLDEPDRRDVASRNGMLAEVAQLLTRTLRASDVLARTGDKELCALLEQTSTAYPVLARLETLLRTMSNERIPRAVRVGVSPLPLGTTGAATIYERAAHAARLARAPGGLVAVQPVRRHPRPSGALPSPVRVAYQPIIELATGTTSRVEALARLTSSDRRCVPTELTLARMSLAERIELHRSVLRTVLEDLEQTPEGRISLNVDSDVLSDLDFAKELNAAAHTVAASRLCFEITERSMLLTAHLGLLSELRESGVSLSLDDFGTGYATLSRLLAMPIDELKLDRSILLRRHVGPLGASIIAIAVALVRALHLDLVVEGADSLAVAGELRTLGVPYAQGFALARPLASLKEALAVRVDITALQAAADPGTTARLQAQLWEQGLACMATAERGLGASDCELVEHLEGQAREEHLARHRWFESMLAARHWDSAKPN